MLRGLLVVISALVVLFASVYQLWVKDFLAVSLGVGRVAQDIEEFPYACRRVAHEKLEACEDLWLDDEARVLYAACTGTEHRAAWNPAMGHLNVSGRRPSGAEIVALDIDSPGEDGLFGLRSIKHVGYEGATGDGTLDLVGFDAKIVDPSTIQFFLVNQRPPVDAERNLVDPSGTGANATIEIFELKRGENEMTHLKTIASPAVWSPNRVAAFEDGSFVVTNDHSVKVGLRRELDPILGGGNVAYCGLDGYCHAASNVTLRFPNGLTRGRDELIYVPSIVDGKIWVFELTEEKTLKHVDSIFVGYPMDNISPDANGDIYVAAFPDTIKTMAAIKEPFKASSPATLFKVSKAGDHWQVDKILEDAKASVLDGSTTVRHDAKTGRLFIGAVLSKFLVVCEPK